MMPELPESIPKVPFAGACVLIFVGFVAIIFGGGPGILIGSVLVLAGAGIGAKLGFDLWKATE